MVDQKTLARVNLYALLRTLEDLPAHDPQARAIASGKRETIQFSVGGLGAARLAIGDGQIRFLPGPGRCSIKLWFPKPENLNAMFAGTGNPIPLKGLTKLAYLKGPFTTLTDRLTHYLRTSPELLKDKAYRDANASLSLRSAVYAIGEIGNSDREGRLNAGRMPDGEILLAAGGGPELTVAAKGGRLECSPGAPVKARARMVFSDLEAAGAMLRGELDSYAAIGAEKLVLGWLRAPPRQPQQDPGPRAPLSTVRRKSVNNYDHTKSKELFARAVKVIPGGVYGHLGPAEGCFMPVGAYPLFSSRAEGAYFWDVDGNRYIDYMCAYGPNILGYNDRDVDAAALAQLKEGNCVTSPSSKMIDLAELLVDTVEMADWAFFCKNGGDTTMFACMIARAATGREKLVLTRGGYHGAQPWTQKDGHPGVTPADVANNLIVEFGDYEALEALFAEHRGEIACFMATPYHHPVFEDNRLPPEGYWKKVRALCDREGVVLAIDDVRCGFRLDVGGSDRHYGFEADIECFCKALANGWKRLRDLRQGFPQGGRGARSCTRAPIGSPPCRSRPRSPAIKKMRDIDAARICTEKGRVLTTGLVAAGRKHGFDLIVSGEAFHVVHAHGERRQLRDPPGLDLGVRAPGRLLHEPPQPVHQHGDLRRGHRLHPRRRRRSLRGRGEERAGPWPEGEVAHAALEG